MTRQTTFLAILVALLLAVGFYFLVFQPGQEEIAEIELELVDVEAQQVTTQTRIAELEQVRSDAATIEAALASAASIIPGQAALPATLRQLQAAADDSGVTLTTITPALPAPIAPTAGGPEQPVDLAQISLAMSAEGSYFQIVDFLRRLEDPAIVSRGVVIDAVTVTPGEYPTLTVTTTGRIFASIVPGPDPTVTAEPEAEATDETEGDAETDVNVDVEVEQ